jgi:hypothetical protein
MMLGVVFRPLTPRIYGLTWRWRSVSSASRFNQDQPISRRTALEGHLPR